jgi:hypothetical protein
MAILEILLNKISSKMMVLKTLPKQKPSKEYVSLSNRKIMVKDSLKVKDKEVYSIELSKD